MPYAGIHKTRYICTMRKFPGGIFDKTIWKGVGMGYLLFSLGVILGCVLTQWLIKHKSANGTFDIIDADGETCVAINFSDTLSDETRTIILTKTRK